MNEWRKAMAVELYDPSVFIGVNDVGGVFSEGVSDEHAGYTLDFSEFTDFLESIGLKVPELVAKIDHVRIGKYVGNLGFMFNQNILSIQAQVESDVLNLKIEFETESKDNPQKWQGVYTYRGHFAVMWDDIK